VAAHVTYDVTHGSAIHLCQVSLHTRASRRGWLRARAVGRQYWPRSESQCTKNLVHWQARRADQITIDAPLSTACEYGL